MYELFLKKANFTHFTGFVFFKKQLACFWQIIHKYKWNLLKPNALFSSRTSFLEQFPDRQGRTLKCREIREKILHNTIHLTLWSFPRLPRLDCHAPSRPRRDRRCRWLRHHPFGLVSGSRWGRLVSLTPLVSHSSFLKWCHWTKLSVNYLAKKKFRHQNLFFTEIINSDSRWKCRTISILRWFKHRVYWWERAGVVSRYWVEIVFAYCFHTHVPM